MTTIPCPHCRRVVPLMLVKDGVCPNCMADIHAVEISPPPPIDDAPPFISTSPAPQFRSRRTQQRSTGSHRTHISRSGHPNNWIALAALVAVVGVVCGALFGVIAAQYFPFFGTFAGIMPPWSPHRNAVMIPHMMLFGFLFPAVAVAGVIAIKSLSN